MKRNMRTIAALSRPDQEEVWVCFLIDKLLYSLPRKEMGAAKMAQSKLQDNLKKLQGISLKMMEMEDTAKSFSSTAKEHAVEFKKWSSKF
ncbi:unnamed protein product [Brassica rapa]|uniref:Uncharacterized protein n=1 Tax=Brassica campestris TaxID=3711 RepID=A0A8D9HPR0_BRACM|nr:unnamed protein product [Brassica rapa]